MIGRAVTETMKAREREEKIGERGCSSDGEPASEAREITLARRDLCGTRRESLDAEVTSSMLVIEIHSLNVRCS